MNSLIAANVSNAGLGNRMRFTLSALSLAEATGRAYSYVWPQTEMFKPPLTDLWNFNHAELPWSDSVQLSKNHPYVRKSEDLDPENSIWHLRSGDALSLPAGAPTWFERFRELVPTVPIKQQVESTFEELKGAPYVGVSIRAHEQSHAKTTQASPVSWYIDRMTEIIEKYPRMKFFISCDVAEVQSTVAALFPNSVALTNKGAYNSADGVRASIVDLYLLASSNYMLVPYWSSFPVMAWELADRKIIMENSRNGRKDVDIARVPSSLDPLCPSDRSTEGG